MTEPNRQSGENEERIIEIEIERLRPFKEHPFQVKDDSVACWVYVQKYVKHKTLNEMLQELPDVGQFILAMDTWFEKLMEK